MVGLLTDAGVPARLGEWLGEQRLAERLRKATGDHWRVEVIQHALPLDEDRHLPMLNLGRDALGQHGWDFVVLVTDLPRRAEEVPILADYGTTDRVGLVSVPALGAMRTRRRALEAVSHLIFELLGRTRSSEVGSGQAGDLRIKRPLGHIAATQEGIGEHIGLLGLRGRVRLLAGMVRGNRPWRLLPSLSTAMAGAATGAAFGVFYSNIWILADASAFPRQLLVSALAMGALVVWLIFDNKLWEHASDTRSEEEVAIANAATVTTIAVAVLYMYLVLFIATLLAASAVIPPMAMERALGHPAAFGDYASLAWLAASMGTLAGALGSGLADEEAVRQAAYSRRENQRRERQEVARGDSE